MTPTVPTWLDRGGWTSAGRRLLAKALGELAYEEMIQPREERPDHYRVELGGVTYRFQARRGAFSSWHVDPATVRRDAGGSEGDADVLQLLVDAQAPLGIPGEVAGHLVRELCSTLAADAELADGRLPVAQLADLSAAELEGHQTGHPWLIANKGRLGFSASDRGRYAPEARRRTRLPWIAVDPNLAVYRGVPDLDAGRLYAEELDQETRSRFAAALAAGGGGPDHLWLPVHPWQWDSVVLPLFAGELAARRIVPLGEGPDLYLPQQSIRTFSNVDRPLARQVKLPLAILNTLVWRGLPQDRTPAAPAVTDWLYGLRRQDPYLRDEVRVVLLGEVASIAVRHPVLDRLEGIPYQYRELLGAIWREPVEAHLEPGERARTLAALLYADATGETLVEELVHRSGRPARDWLRALFRAMLPPLLHFLYRWGVVFSPHGENAAVIFDAEEMPSRLAIKDFVDDVNLSAEPLPELEATPPEVADVLLREPPGFLCQFIQSGLFVGHYRYLAELVDRRLGISAGQFWGLLREQVDAYQRRWPELRGRFELFDLTGPDLERLCLNRNRLLVDGYRDRPERPHAVSFGRVPNPVHDVPVRS
jgi:siderophore synthetase component